LIRKIARRRRSEKVARHAPLLHNHHAMLAAAFAWGRKQPVRL
jgi:hypothetical protein